eukprot:SAG22_NODE_1277_length_4907_cov_2.638311_3_plen_220_part_00
MGLGEECPAGAFPIEDEETCAIAFSSLKLNPDTVTEGGSTSYCPPNAEDCSNSGPITQRCTSTVLAACCCETNGEAQVSNETIDAFQVSNETMMGCLATANSEWTYQFNSEHHSGGQCLNADHFDVTTWGDCYQICHVPAPMGCVAFNGSYYYAPADSVPAKTSQLAPPFYRLLGQDCTNEDCALDMDDSCSCVPKLLPCVVVCSRASARTHCRCTVCV